MNINSLKIISLFIFSAILMACSASDEATPDVVIEATSETSVDAISTSADASVTQERAARFNEVAPFDLASLYDESSATRAEVMMTAYLEENRGWCLDAPSAVSGIAGLHTHTCYLYRNDGADGVAHDQAFIVELAEQHGIFYLVDYDLCLTMFEPEEGSFVALEACGGDLSHLQKMTMSEEGLVASAYVPELCMTTGEYTTPGGGGNPMHIIRKLTFENCDPSRLDYQAWEFRTDWPGLAADYLITEERAYPSLAVGMGMGG